MVVVMESLSLDELKKAGEAPEWLSLEGFETLRKGYLLPGESPRAMYRRVSTSAARHLNKPDLAEVFFQLIDKNWLCLATPVASNAGTARGLPISCYGMTVPDSLDGIYMSYHETAMLTKGGGGIGKYWGGLRGRGAQISGNGVSDGIIPWLKVEEATLQSTSQGGVRRGSGAQYLDVNSNEIEEFIDLRRNTGDIARRCLSNNFHHGVVLDDAFMKDCERNGKSEELWIKILTTRVETGEPYTMWRDTANRAAPQCYKDRGLTINTSQLCNEIYLHTDDDHTFVCCLSSMNLARWAEWKDTNAVEMAIWFLDGIMSEFIEKAEGLVGFERAVRFAKKGRALGLGVLGWHTLLQARLVPFESWEAMQLNAQIFRTINDRSHQASRDLAAEYGECEWTSGHGLRNTHTNAVAPTVSNSLISGGVSQGIEPLVANYYAQKTAKGTFIRKNRQLEELLERKGKNTFDTWEEINKNQGSVRRLSFLSIEEREVFATAREINQFAIVRQAGQRQQWIDQGQSVNLFFTVPDQQTPELRRKLGNYVHEVHLEAYRLGLKGLYYVRPTSVLQGDSIYREGTDCKSCEA